MKDDLNKLYEQYLIEKTRNQLVDKSKSADKTKAYGTTRWDRRRAVSIFPTVANYNRVDMNALFHGDLLNFIVPVHGDHELEDEEGREHKDYAVEVLFEHILQKVQDELKANGYKLEFKIVYRALVNAINSSDILVGCTCPDFYYTHSYQATKGQYNASNPQIIPAPITNPNDTKGAGCKHIMNVLGNLDWAMKLASCINNYIFYMKDHYEDKFASIIWPAISGMEYDKAYQQGLFDNLANTMVDDAEDDDEQEINIANEYGKERTRFKSSDNQDKIDEPEDQEAEGQLQMDLDNGTIEEPDETGEEEV